MPPASASRTTTKSAAGAPATRRFSQVNVFSRDALAGNPLAVVHAADGMTDEQMAALARWTNLSETTFLLRPTDPGADYRVRIFTPARELPFAGHPTLGSCHAWLAAGGQPKEKSMVVQQCGVGLVRVRREGGSLAFAAPPLIRSGPLEPEVLEKIRDALALVPADIVRHQWVDNGPGWCAVMLASAQQVLAVRPDWSVLQPLKLGVIGPQAAGQDAAFEVRAFTSGYEDPVTGSLNASLAQWLFREGLAKGAYVAAQGTALRRAGRVRLAQEGDTVWVSGESVEVIQGEIRA